MATSRPAGTSPCPSCRQPRAAGKYLCGDCWSALPGPARTALNRRGNRATALHRLQELHRQLAAGVPLTRIEISP
ncbi:hypothetical protein ABTX35_33070 [Streptomyces sp. NPDC096080]|uniref:hypothetical protein n=1 Tax=Streptomyces sp. NPDC096080 TaxID=3156693 RepID=UPI00332ECE73